MDNQAMFNALQKTLIDGLAQTENRVLNEVAEIKTDMVTKSELNQLEAGLDKRFDALDQKLTSQQIEFETDVSNEMLSDKQQMQNEVDFLKQRIKQLEQKISAM